MKNSLDNLFLQKRNEWPIDGDPQADWQQMQSLLDMHMPVNGTGASGGNGGGGSGLSGGLGGIKLISALIVTLSASAVIIYYVVKGHKNNDRQKHQTEQTISKNNIKQQKNSLNNLTDSIGTAQPSQPGGNNTTLPQNSNPALNTNGAFDKNNVDGNGKITANNKAHNYTRGATVASTPFGLSNGPTMLDVKAKGSSAITKPGGKTTVNNLNGPNERNDKTGSASNSGNDVKSNNRHRLTHLKNNPAKAISSKPPIAISSASRISSDSYSKPSNKFVSRYGKSKKANAVTPYQKNNTVVHTNSRSNGRYQPSAKYNNNLANKPGIPAIPKKVKSAESVQGITDIANTKQETGNANTTLVAVVPPLPFWDQTLKANIGTPIKSQQIIAPPTVKTAKKGNDNKLELGLLLGVNAPGSFTDKSQNANIYGSLPVDGFLGLFANYTANKKWGFNLQPKILSPQTVSGSYSHLADSKVDSGKKFMVTDSRKIYFIDVPLHIVYNATPNIRLMAGAAISFPVKQANGNALLVRDTALKDSVYYVKVRGTISNTRYSTQPSLGLSGGVSFYYRRLYLNATYLKSITSQSITSDLGSYNFNHDILQFSLGLRFK